MRIHRARALDCVDQELGTLALHFIISFDLMPGHTICLAMRGDTPPWTIFGPHLLRPEFWDADGLDQSVANPLAADSYEILLYPGRAPSLLAQNGDAIVYTTLAQDPAAIFEDEEMSTLQLYSGRPLRDRNFATALSGVKRQVSFEVYAQDEVRGRQLPLFPLLWPDCSEVPMPTTHAECERFLQACKSAILRRDLPDEFAQNIKPITLAYLETCEDDITEKAEYHIYTDGSSYVFRGRVC